MKNIFKNISILPLIALFIASSTLSSCSENNSDTSQSKLNANLALFENKLKNMPNTNNTISRKIQYNEESLKNDKNKYDAEGLIILQKHKAIENHVNEILPNPSSTYQNNLKPFIDEQISSFNTISLDNLNADEKILLESFQNNFKASVELILDYENFVYDNYEDQSKVKNFLIIISRIKYAIFITDSDIANKRTFSGWESCLVQCMGHTYGSYNAVRWIQFGINPGADVLWTFASCGWDCRVAGYYGH